MTTPAIRGSWTVGDAVYSRWKTKNLSTLFRNEWGAAQSSTEYQPWNDRIAQPARGDGARHPVPYCVFDQGDPILIHRSSGITADTINETHDVPFQFTIYHKSKADAIRVAKLVAEAYDRAVLPIDVDKQIEIFREPDFGDKGTDETWFWTLPYRVRIDITYPAATN